MFDHEAIGYEVIEYEGIGYEAIEYKVVGHKKMIRLVEEKAL